MDKGSEAERDGAHKEQTAKDFARTELIAQGAGNKAHKQAVEC
jgi:hypothetical protein